MRFKTVRILLPFALTTLLFLSFVSKPCSGQSPSYIHFSVAEGLPSSEVYDVFQDKKGFMWFATDNGVVRYDGYQMEVIQSSEGLTDPVVFGFVEDSKGRIWFRTISGRLSYYFNKNIYKYRYNDALAPFCKNSILSSLYVDSTDNVWFGTGIAIGKIDSAGRVYEYLTKMHCLNLKKIEGKLLVGYSGLAKLMNTVFANNRFLPIKLVDQINNHPIICTLFWKGKEYFSVGSTVFRIDKNSITSAYVGNDQILSLTIDQTEQLWIGYQLGGLECLRDFNHLRLNQFTFLNEKSVTKVFQDQHGGYWISTLQDGIFYIPELNHLIKSISYNSKIRAGDIIGNSGVVIGDVLGNLQAYDQKGNLQQKKSLNASSVLSILSTTKNNVWVCTPKQTSILDHSLNSKKTLTASYSNLHEDSEGAIWAISGPALKKFNTNGEKLGEQMFSKNYRNLFVSENIYLFGRLGLDVFTKKFDPVKIPEIFEGLKVSKILKLDSTTLLIATIGNGFFVVNRLDWSFEHYRSNNKFTANNVYSAVVADSTLWLGTENGIVATPIHSLLLKSPDYFFHTQKTGLPVKRIEHLIYCKPNIWAFYENGFCLVRTSLSRKQDTPIFYLKNILINNQSVNLSNVNELAHDRNNIQIDFGFIDFKNQNIFIRSRLSPKAPWNYSTERSIKYYSLNPDNYSFQMEYSLDHNRWTTVLSKDFLITPQWWKDYRFQIAIAVALFIFSFIYFKRILSRLREKQNFLEVISSNQQKLIEAELTAREGERSRIAKDLHDSVGTSLAAAKMGLYKIFKGANPNVSIIEEQLQETMQEVKSIVNELFPAGLDRYGVTKVVNNYIQNIMSRFEIKIEVHTFGPDLNDQKININLFRIVQELLSNSLKHAKAKNIAIHINSFDDRINILYQDDGIGFSKESSKIGSGLLNIESRVQTLNGKLQLEASQFGVSYCIDVPIKQQLHDTNGVG
jgi:signal transduction histidine kinase/ligand-binding sensor domain-containing protein